MTHTVQNNHKIMNYYCLNMLYTLGGLGAFYYSSVVWFEGHAD